MAAGWSNAATASDGLGGGEERQCGRFMATGADGGIDGKRLAGGRGGPADISCGDYRRETTRDNFTIVSCRLDRQREAGTLAARDEHLPSAALSHIFGPDSLHNLLWWRHSRGLDRSTRRATGPSVGEEETTAYHIITCLRSCAVIA